MSTPGITVKDWMTPVAHAVRPHDTIEHAREVCERERVNQLPVLANGTLVGIVTDRDLRDAFPSLDEQAKHPDRAHRKTASVMVEDVMTANVLTVTETDLIELAASVLKRERIGGLPVVRDGHLVGMLTRSDLLGALVAILAARRAA
jgi:acetoin utilization protein AcuB